MLKDSDGVDHRPTAIGGVALLVLCLKLGGKGTSLLLVEASPLFIFKPLGLRVRAPDGNAPEVPSRTSNASKHDGRQDPKHRKGE